MSVRDRTAPVLVVDDSWYMQSLFRDALESAGLEVVCTGTAAEALRLYGEVRPGLVLMDLVLPDVDGITATSQIRNLDPEARVLVVTGFVDERARMLARQAGVAGFLSKPISGRELAAQVRAALGLPVGAAWGLQTRGAPALAA